MRAAMLTRFGGPDAFTLVDVERPRPAADQMLIQVAACGVCGHDLLNRAGAFPHTRLPTVMGHEIAGTVVQVGALVTQFRPGDRVAVIQRMPCGLCRLCRSGRENLCVSGHGFYGETQSGGYGEYVLATARNTAAVPEHMPLRVAAVLSCALGTGYHALRRAGLEPGDCVVVTGASGGIGIHTVKLAKLFGLRCIAVSSSQDKVDRLRAAGATDVIVAPDFAFHVQVRALTEGQGADAVIEIAGRPTFHSSIRSLRAGGRMVLVGNVDPGAVPLNPAMAILKELNVIGSAHATLSDLKRVIELVARGVIAPEIDAFLPLADVAAAHRMMQARSTCGRVVLVHEGAGA